MSNPVLNIKTADEAEIVFYEAFNYGDMEVMAALWQKGEVVCVHPGSGAILGYDAVIRSWRHVLESEQRAYIRHKVLQKTQDNDIAVHVVAEQVMDNDVVLAVVLATNVFKKLDGNWQIIQHHGSLVQMDHSGETLQ